MEKKTYSLPSKNYVDSSKKAEELFDLWLKMRLSSSRNKEELLLIKKAFNFASLAHSDHKRLNGELYVSHPLKSAIILEEWNLDINTVVACLLHDVVDDGGALTSDILEEFGQDVANLVRGVSTVSAIRLKGSHQDVFVESLRRMILVMAKDLRVVFIKLAERTHNMQTLSALDPVKQKKIAKETIEVFAPLAERLGMGAVKANLEDLSFPYLYPDEYKKIVAESKTYYKKASIHSVKAKRQLLQSLNNESIKSEVFARKKHLYSLFRKLRRPEIDGDYQKIHDIVAVRILVSKVNDCYAALGVVHSIFKPVPHLGISDFIAQPKPNGYKSIHTKVFGPEGRIIEVQIRTFNMHNEAEHGAAAHWAYSELKSKGVKDAILERGKADMVQDKLLWVQELVKWQKEVSDSKEFLNVVKFDGFAHRNFVFSPKGDVYDLPRGATIVDFAFSVHSKLGFYIHAAKVNGKIAPLTTILKSGDVVEIIKSKNPHAPNRDWLSFVVTSIARRSIQKALLKL